jgi:hypothetical protein
VVHLRHHHHHRRPRLRTAQRGRSGLGPLSVRFMANAVTPRQTANTLPNNDNPPAPLPHLDPPDRTSRRYDPPSALPLSASPTSQALQGRPSVTPEPLAPSVPQLGPSVPPSGPSVSPFSFPYPVPTRKHSDASSCLPHWVTSIAAWRAADPSSSNQRHCDRILDHITHGLPVDPHPMPTDRHYPNTPLVIANADTIRPLLDEYLAMRAIERCQRSDIASVHPLHAVIRDDPSRPRKLRLVIDLSRNLNDFLHVRSMRHASTIDAAVALSTPACWYSKVDIKDCFLSFTLRNGAERFLGFRFEGQCYRFTRLMFGLNTAPEMCELMLSVVSWQLTQLGVVHVRYCDDILIFGSSRTECDSRTATALSCLDAFGFAVAHHKTTYAAQVIEFLGILLDSIAGATACPPHRLADLTLRLTGVLEHGPRHSVRSILSLVGKLSFAAHVLPGARPFFRSLIDSTRGLHRRAQVTLLPAALDDVKYWLNHLRTWNGRQVWRSTPPIVIATDASLVGWGGLVISSPFPLPPHLSVGGGTAGGWCIHHPVSSSSDIGWAELFAVLYMIAAVGPVAPNSTITFLVDNQADVAIINRQSTRSPAILCDLRRRHRSQSSHHSTAHSWLHQCTC